MATLEKAVWDEISTYQKELNERLVALEERERKAEARENRARLGLGGGGAADGAAMNEETKAFVDFARTGRADLLTKAMSIGDSTGGGYVVPSVLDQQIQVVAGLYSPMRRIARVVTGVADGFATVVSTGTQGTAWVAESATRSETSTASMARVKPTHGELYSNAVASSWLLQDSAYPLDSWLTNELGRSQGIAEGAAFITGDGVNKPSGLAAATYAATADASRAFGTVEYLASGSNGTFDIDDCIDLFYKLKPEYRAPGRCSWLMSPGALQIIRKQKASTAGSYMWEPSSKDGQPSTLLGVPVYEDSNIAAPATDSLSVFVGDFSRGYMITEYGYPRFIRDEISQKGYVGFYVARRIGGAVVDSNAIKALKLAS